LKFLLLLQFPTFLGGRRKLLGQSQSSWITREQGRRFIQAVRIAEIQSAECLFLLIEQGRLVPLGWQVSDPTEIELWKVKFSHLTLLDER